MQKSAALHAILIYILAWSAGDTSYKNILFCKLFNPVYVFMTFENTDLGTLTQGMSHVAGNSMGHSSGASCCQDTC